MPKFRFFIFLVSWFTCFVCVANESTYQKILKGKVCTENPSTQQIDCEYKINTEFWLSIAGIGLPDTAVTFMKADFNGKYYGTFGLLHGCVVVKPGVSNKDSLSIDMAFVSPKNGKIYQTWQLCQSGE
jgi:hypothetical protein